MNKKLLGILAIANIFLFTGCVKPVEVKKYTPLKTRFASESITGTPLRITYDLSGDSSTLRGIYYHIYNAKTNKLLVSDWLPKKDIQSVFGVTQNTNILGTIGDKVVFVWRNGGGFSDTFLSVYDFSEKRTYHLLEKDDKFSIMQKGNSYILLTSQNKVISLNNLKELDKNGMKGYKPLSLGYFYSGLDNKARNGKRKTIFTPDSAYFYINSAANTTGKLDNLMFGAYRKLNRAYIVPRVY